MNETFVSCGGDEDCLGAPLESEDIVYREVIGLGPSLPGQEDYQYRLNTRCAHKLEGAQEALECCASEDPYLCEAAPFFCVCESVLGNSSEYSKLERCQEGRVNDSVTCAVCEPEYMRTRGGCVRCYEASTRYTVLVIVIAILIIVFVLIRRCWKKMYRYRTAWRDVMRIIIINVTLMQINQSLETMIPIEWPDIWLDFKEYFEWVDIDIMSLSGTTCVAGVNYFVTFAVMGSVPYIILLMAFLYFLWRKSTLNHYLSHMSKEHRNQARQDAYLEAFLLGDKDGDGLLTPHELADLLNHELHLDKFKHGQFKIDPTHSLRIIREISHDQSTMEMPLMMFMDAMEDDTLDHAVNHVCELPVKHKNSGKDAMLKFIVDRGLFASSFMIATHLLLLAHSPVSKKVFVYFLCRNVGGQWYIRSDYSIQCYESEWLAFQPFVMLVLGTFTIGFPLLLSIMFFRFRNKLYKREIYAKMGFLYERYVRGSEWWEIHEMMRKAFLTGILLFTSERPMVRAVCGTLVCCLMIINLNYFQPHRNLIVFWVEQLANLSATIKYLFAVVIAAGATDSAGGENSKLSPEDADIMGVMLICSDIACMACSFFAMIACVLLLRRSILAAKREEKAQEEEEQEAPEFGIHSINRKLNRHSSLMKKMSATAIMPQVHRRESLRNEGNAAHKGLHAMFEHANDHLKKKSPFGMLGKGGKKTISLKAMVETAHQEKKVKATEQEHDASLKRLNSEIRHKEEHSHDRLQQRLQRRQSTRKMVVTPAMLKPASSEIKIDKGKKEMEEEDEIIIDDDEEEETETKEDMTQENLLRLQLKNSELVMKLKKMPQHKEINGAHLEKMLGQIGLGNKGELRDQILRHLHAHKDGSTTILIGDVVSWVNK